LISVFAYQRVTSSTAKMPGFSSFEDSSSTQPKLSSPPSPIQIQTKKSLDPVLGFLNDEAAILQNPSTAPNDMAHSPAQTLKRLNETAAHLSLRQIQLLEAKASNEQALPAERMVAIDLLSRNGSDAALYSLEKTALKLKNLDQKTALGKALPFEAGLALWIIDSIAHQDDQQSAQTSLSRLATGQNLRLVSHYLSQVRQAVRGDKVREFYEHQDRLLKKAAAI
jgi:hypothetical protein